MPSEFQYAKTIPIHNRAHLSIGLFWLFVLWVVLLSGIFLHLSSNLWTNCLTSWLSSKGSSLQAASAPWACAVKRFDPWLSNLCIARIRQAFSGMLAWPLIGLLDISALTDLAAPYPHSALIEHAKHVLCARACAYAFALTLSVSRLWEYLLRGWINRWLLDQVCGYSSGITLAEHLPAPENMVNREALILCFQWAKRVPYQAPNCWRFSVINRNLSEVVFEAIFRPLAGLLPFALRFA